ncbi:MAG: hypothetical protein Q3971_06335 [Moraxella sp.]|nr:hypothetical protein [Moraxella sp.]
MIAFIFNVVIILIVMKIFFKFMYPKPPKHFMPKEGDDTSIRVCNHCGHGLATYRGILSDDGFFCNDEHKNAYLKDKSPNTDLTKTT